MEGLSLNYPWLDYLYLGPGRLIKKPELKRMREYQEHIDKYYKDLATTFIDPSHSMAPPMGLFYYHDIIY